MLSANGTNPQSFVLGLVGLVAITVLMAMRVVPSEVGTPVISAVVMGGIGQANGYRNGKQAQ